MQQRARVGELMAVLQGGCLRHEGSGRRRGQHAAARAHSASAAYLTLSQDPAAAVIHAQWDTALRDLNFVLRLDDDGDGHVRWRELKHHQASIEAYAYASLKLSTPDGPCALQPIRQLVEAHADGAYAALFFDISYARSVQRLALKYSLFFKSRSTAPWDFCPARRHRNHRAAAAERRPAADTAMSRSALPANVLLLRRWIAAVLMTAALFAVTSGATEAAGEPLDTVTVVASGAGSVSAASAGEVGPQQLQSEPLLRPAAILEHIPGLIVTQHSGEGKANQYFLRAFNLDHGTDLALEVDEMPVNMPSHAHGQGYADFNFVIPELAEDLQYEKGPYHADQGDFATAGSAHLSLLNQAPGSATLALGQDLYRRGLLIGSSSALGGTLLGAAEVYRNDGPFDVPDDYHRLNGLLRYFRGDARDYTTLTAMAYSGQWNSTDQVPQRAVAAGIIGRFGSLNPTDGGISSRYSLSFSRVRRGDEDQVQFSAYLIRYKLDLWSTFTFFLQDPAEGDQMLQQDDRIVYGFKASKSWFKALFGAPTSYTVGMQTRIDDIKNVGIFSTVQRQALGTTQDASVLESSAALYAESSTRWTDHLQTILGVREDQADFEVRDKMRNPDGSCDLNSDPLGCVTGRKRAGLFSPKFSAVLGPWADSNVFLNIGEGHHSNDARGVTRSGPAADMRAVTPLTRALGAEIGLATKSVPDLYSRLDVFALKLKSELIFDGDAGVTSPSGSSTRTGVEWANTYRISRWLSAQFNTAFTRARFDRDSAVDDLGCGAAAPSIPCAPAPAIVGRYIPNSPTNVTDAALIAQRQAGWFGAVRARHFGASALVEDNSVSAPAYTTVDAQLGFRSANWLAAVDIFNIAGIKWNDIEYYYASRLKNEAAPQADYVVHPGVPRTLRAHFQYQF